MKRKISQQAIDAAKKARRVILIEENEMYRIEKIPLNYRITIKLPFKKEHEFRKLDREIYSDLDNGLNYAKELTNDSIEKWYIKPGEKGWEEAMERKIDFLENISKVKK